MILKKLQEALKDKTYLLVLDDVWNDDLLKWEDFINSVFGVTSTKGNAIIMTTRSTQAASVACPLHTRILEGLSDEDCWSIIKAKTFENGEAPSSGFETIGRKIAKRCQGLPLTACVIGCKLYHRRSENEWDLVEQKWLTDVDVDILKSLRKSFDHLSSPLLRKCFTYCSVFSKGRQIKKQELIEMWMAEGFLGVDERNEEMKYVGDVYFQLLLRNSLLQQVSGEIILEILQFKGRTKSCPPKRSGKVFAQVILEGDISGTVFSNFESLHVLTLDSSIVKKLPSSIRKLIHLRNLNISKTSIEKLPDWIDELHQLQTLRAEGEYLRKLPSTLKYLIKLRHLYIDDKVELPAEIGRLTHLRTLRYFRVGAKNGFKIEELGSLKNLKGNLTINNLEKVGGKEEAEKAHMSLKKNLMELVLKWGRNREGETNDESVLEGFQPHRNISRLGIEGFKGKRFPRWTMKMEVQDEHGGSWVGLHRLEEIRLSWCSECEEISTLEHLPNLKSLYLERLKNVRFIDSSFRNLMKLHIEGLERLESLPHLLFLNNPNLSVLEIIDCPELRELPDGGNSLEELEIWNCPNLKSIGNITVGEGGVQPRGTKLGKLRLGGVANSMATTSSVESFQGINVDAMLQSCSNSLAHLELRGTEDWASIPESIRHLTAFSELKLENFGVEEFPEWLGSFSSLKDLSIYSCKNLARLPSAHALHSLAGLQSLTIGDCAKLLVDSEWRNVSHLRIEVDGRPIDSGSLQ